MMQFLMIFLILMAGLGMVIVPYPMMKIGCVSLFLLGIFVLVFDWFGRIWEKTMKDDIYWDDL